MVLIVSISIIPRVQSVQLRGAGASFPAEVYKAWISSYIAIRREYVADLTMTYDSVGSGGGKTRIQQVSSK